MGWLADQQTSWLIGGKAGWWVSRDADTGKWTSRQETGRWAGKPVQMGGKIPTVDGITNGGCVCFWEGFCLGFDLEVWFRVSDPGGGFVLSSFTLSPSAYPT